MMGRSRGWKALVAVLCALTLTATAAACGSSKSSGSGDSGGSTIGVTADSIKIGVSVADLDGLRAAGINLAPALTTKNLAKRVTSYFDEWNAAGGINGRQVVPVVLTWDPVKPATAQKVCDDATINNELFAFINTNGIGAKYIECIAAAGVPTFFGDVAPQSAHDTGWLTSISGSAEVNATSGINAAIASGQIPKGASVGILAGNSPEHVAAAAAAKTALEANGNKVTAVAVDTLQGDVGVMSTESAAAINTFKAANVTNVVIALQFTSSGGFWDGVGDLGWKFTFLDIASSMCTAFGGKSLKPSAVGGICYTVFGDSTNSEGKMATETDFEKECRAHFDQISAGDYPTKSYPGVPSGEVRTLPDGTQVSADYSPNDCTIANVIKLGLEKAGKNLTREGFMTAVRGLGDVPIALGSNGKGSQTEGKTYLSTLVHGDVLTAAPTGTAKNANGTYNGCPVDVQCWVPANNTWYPISQ